MIGRITSTKAMRTATVLVERTKRHPLYKKDFVSTKKYLVDVETAVKVGDIVEFLKCRPVSKQKHWRVIKVLGQDFVALGEEQLKESAEQAIAEVLPEEKEEEESVILASEATPELAKKDSGQARKTKKGKEK
jgi:small subunit ribosomal protein S17